MNSFEIKLDPDPCKTVVKMNGSILFGIQKIVIEQKASGGAAEITLVFAGGKIQCDALTNVIQLLSAEPKELQ